MPRDVHVQHACVVSIIKLLHTQSALSATEGVNKKFTFRFRSMVILRYKPFRFYGIPRFCGSTIADSAIIGFRTEQVIFNTTYLWLEASYRHRIKFNI